MKSINYLTIISAADADPVVRLAHLAQPAWIPAEKSNQVKPSALRISISPAVSAPVSKVAGFQYKTTSFTRTEDL